MAAMHGPGRLCVAILYSRRRKQSFQFIEQHARSASLNLFLRTPHARKKRNMVKIADLDACGSFSLTVEEKALLGNSILSTQLANGGDLELWGKILTRGEVDYLIVSTPLNDGEGTVGKKFYFCTTDSIDLKPLPAPNDLVKSDASALTGDASRELEIEVPVPEEKEGKGEDEEEEKEESEPTVFTEADRLACIVGAIDADTAIAPRGAYKVTPTREIVRNSGFSGLSDERAVLAESYLLVREPSSAATKLERDGMLKDSDFMDSIASAVRGSWSIQTRPDRSVELKSLVWPGYTFFHKLGSAQYGGVYVGDGTKNADLAFML